MSLALAPRARGPIAQAAGRPDPGGAAWAVAGQSYQIEHGTVTGRCRRRLVLQRRDIGDRGGGPGSGSAALASGTPGSTTIGDMPVTTRRVLLAKPRGYCAGVDRAVQAVEMALERYGAPVYVRKQIVHNTHVVRDAGRARRDLRGGGRRGARGRGRRLLRARGITAGARGGRSAAACGPSTPPARWSPRCTTRPGGSRPRTTTSCSSATRAMRKSSAPPARRPAASTWWTGRTAAPTSRSATRPRWPGCPRPRCRWTRPCRPWPRCASASRCWPTRPVTTSATPPRTASPR